MFLANIIRWQFGKAVEHALLTDRCLYLEEKGFQVTSTVTKDCYALVAGDTVSSKYKKAVTIGVNVIDYWSSKKDVLSGNF